MNVGDVRSRPLCMAGHGNNILGVRSCYNLSAHVIGQELQSGHNFPCDNTVYRVNFLEKMV